MVYLSKHLRTKLSYVSALQAQQGISLLNPNIRLQLPQEQVISGKAMKLIRSFGVSFQGVTSPVKRA